MYRSRSTSATVTAGLLLVGSVVGMISCQDSTATSPSAQRVTPAAHLTRALPNGRANPMSLWALSGSKKKLRCDHAGPQTASAVIGPEGGTLRVGRHRLIVPAGALSQPTRITGSVPADSSATVTFEPSGLRFQAAATLVFNVEGCDGTGDDPSVMYIDDAGRPLEHLPGVFDRAREEVTTPILHFSGYQVWV